LQVLLLNLNNCRWRRKSEVGSWKLEVGSWKLEVGRRKTEDGSRRKKLDNNTNKTMVKFKFEKLIIWQNAMEYGESIYVLTYKFPKEEIY